MRVLASIVLAICVATVAARAQMSSTSSAYRPGPGRPPMGEWGPRRPPEEGAKWADVEAFFKENSPHRYEAMLKLDEREQQRFKDQMTRQYMMLRAMEKGDPELGEIRKGQIRIEDEIFAARMSLIESPGASEAEREEQRNQLRRLIKQRVEMRMEERAVRLEQAKELLEQEEERLSSDREHEDEIVAREYEMECKSMTPMRWPGDGRRPPGRRSGGEDGGRRPGGDDGRWPGGEGGRRPMDER